MKRLSYTPIDGSECTPFPGAVQVRRARPSRLMGVTIVVRHSLAGKKLDKVDELGARLPRERQYLSREEFREVHGADPADIDIVRRFASKNQLRVVDDDTAARTVELRGTVASFSRAFRLEPLIFRHSTGIFRGYTGPVHVPAELDGVVQAVIGFDTRAQVRRRCVPRIDQGGAWPHAGLSSYNPDQVAKLYQFPDEVRGRGQCIAILEFGGGFVPGDLRKYFRELDIPTPKVTWFSVGAGRNAPTGDPYGDDGEVTLDIQVAGSVAPEAEITVCFAASTVRGFLRAINATIHDEVHRPTVISISWGAPEASWNPQALRVLNDCFKAAATMGVTVCCASGNGGSSDEIAGRLAHVDFPASSPYVLACGGTRLQSSARGTFDEIVWNQGPSGGATGGGVSDFFPRPSWQDGARVPTSANMSKHQGRGLPDVAGDADPETGYRVRVQGVDTVIGGTGAVAPLWGGLTALLSEQIGHPVGYLNPLLYKRVSSVEGAFRDIVDGNNDVTGHVGAYSATGGWDPCTGFGSPNGVVLARALSGSISSPRKKRVQKKRST